MTNYVLINAQISLHMPLSIWVIQTALKHIGAVFDQDHGSWSLLTTDKKDKSQMSHAVIIPVNYNWQ